jgi:hypothetical protein
MNETDRNYAKVATPVRGYEAQNQAQNKLAEMSGGAMAGRQSSKTLLLEHAERLRRQANQIEGLAYAVEMIGGDAENTLYGLLSGEIHRR